LQLQSWRAASPCLLLYFPRHIARSLAVTTFLPQVVVSIQDEPPHFNQQRQGMA
jgi:hypothetical protein